MQEGTILTMDNTSKKPFFYGWIIIGCLFLIAMFPMVFYSTFFSYYQMPISTEFGCTYAEFSVANVMSTIASILFSLTLASKLGKGNLRLYMLIGGIIGSAALVVQSYVTAIWQLYITFFIVNFAFAAITYVPINILISQWFVDKKALVTSIVFTGSGVGGMVFSGMFAKVLADYGWRNGFRLTALICIITVLINFIFIRKTPAEKGQEPYRLKNAQAHQAAAGAPVWAGLSKGEAVKTVPFYFYAGALICCGIVAAGVFTQVPTFLTENGVNYAAVMAVVSGAGILGKLVIGPIIDKIGIKKGSILTCVLAVISLVCLALVPEFGAGTAYAMAVIMPFGSCITALAPPLLTGQIFGYKDYGGIYGLGNSCFMAGCMIGPMLSSGIRTATGSYFAAWVACMVVYVLLALCVNLAINTGKKLKPENI